MITSGGPSTSGAPSPGTRTIRSANGTTRSSRCSAMTTVSPRSCTRRARVLEDLFGRGRIEGRRGLVEHQQPGRRRQHGPDGHPLLLTTRQRSQGSIPQVLEAEQIDGVLHASAHGIGGHAEVLHGVGQLVLDRLGHERGQRVLPDEADDVGQIARSIVLRRPPVHRHGTGEHAAAEVRNQPVDRPQQGRLPGTRFPDHHAQLTLGDVERDPVQRRPGGVGVGEGHVVEPDHAEALDRSGGNRAADLGVGRLRCVDPRDRPPCAGSTG